MNKKYLYLGLAFILLITSVCSAGCITGGNSYVVGLSSTYAPLSEYVNGEFTGLDVDILNWIADDQGLSITFVPCMISDYKACMASGKIDAMAALAITEERKSSVDFSDSYYSGLFQLVALKKGNVTDEDVLSGKASISCQMGSAQARSLVALFGQDEFDRRVGEGSIILRPVLGAAMKDVATSNADVAILSDIFVPELLRTYTELHVIGSIGDVQQAAYGVSKDNPELLEKINAGLRNLKASSAWQQMLDKYDIPTKKDTYVVGVDVELYPFNYINETGVLVGYDTESIEWIANDQGFTVEFKYLPWSESISSVESGDIDVWYSYMVATDSRAKRVTFTMPYYESDTPTSVILTHTTSGINTDTLYSGDVCIGVTSGTVESSWVSRIYFDDYYDMVLSGKIRYYPGHESLLNAFSSGEVNVIAISRLPLRQEIVRGDYVVLAESDNNDKIAAAVSNGEVYLLGMLNEGISHLINSGKAAELKEKYGLK